MRHIFYCHLCGARRVQLYHGYPLCNRCRYALAQPVVDQSPVVLDSATVAAALNPPSGHPVISAADAIAALARSTDRKARRG